MNITRLYQAFVTVGPHVHGGPEAYFEDLSHVTFIAKSFLYCTQTLIIDGVVVCALSAASRTRRVFPYLCVINQPYR